MNPADNTRRSACVLMAVVAIAAICGRILSATFVYEPPLYRNAEDPPPGRVWPKTRPEPTPTFSSNDRSRWATARALVHEGTFVIGRRDPARRTETNKYGEHGIIFEDGWGTIDRVLRPEPREGGVQEFYSSKPPLLSTLIAGEYWLLYHGFGLSLADPDKEWVVVRVVLLTVNALPMLVFLLMLARMVEPLGATDWGRLYVVAVACFGTFLTTFATTLNNHGPAAWCAMLATAAAVRIWSEESAPAWLYAAAGFCATLAATFDLPAASFAALLIGLLLLRSPARGALAVLAALVPVAGFFVTNYAALGQWKPAYGEFGGPWYEYEGSHWIQKPGEVKYGIDWAFQKEPYTAYVFHFLIGHHGVFSLSPVWLLALVGMLIGTWGLVRTAGKGRLGLLLSGREGHAGAWTLLAASTLLVSVTVVLFYLTWHTRWNYGGWTSGPRWLLWLTPLWLLCLLPAADWLGQRRWGRLIGYLLLGVSVMSVSYPAWNPWRHPWLYNLLEWTGWVRY
jgi:hypothetical protein